MRLRGTPKTEYNGLSMFCKGYVWRISVTMGRDENWKRLAASSLFIPQALRRELEAAGLSVEYVRLIEYGQRCEIATAGRRTRVEGRKITKVLSRRYSDYRGTKIRWDWDIIQGV